MKIARVAVILSAVVFFAASANKLSATTYTDTTGDATVGGQLGAPGSQILDITSVEVNNNASDLIFKVNLNGDPTVSGQDWGKYMVGIDSAAGGDTAGNGWGRPISMSAGMDYWIGSWVDSGNGIENRNWTGSGWNLLAASYGPNAGNVSISKNSSSVTLTVKLADLGLSPGNSFNFDVYSSGGGSTDGAVDALANPSQTIANWSDPYNSASPNVRSYTVVPEPSTFALLALGGLALVGVIRRRR
jgi:hypothetical protein